MPDGSSQETSGTGGRSSTGEAASARPAGRSPGETDIFMVSTKGACKCMVRSAQNVQFRLACRRAALASRHVLASRCLPIERDVG